MCPVSAAVSLSYVFMLFRDVLVDMAVFDGPSIVLPMYIIITLSSRMADIYYLISQFKVLN